MSEKWINGDDTYAKKQTKKKKRIVPSKAGTQ